jgi:phosphotransferase system HPr (HPr) family protein
MKRVVTASQALHARPASLLARAAAGFESKLSVALGEAEADAKSVLSLMALDVAAGDSVTVRADGPDAEEAIARLVAQITQPEIGG